MVSRREVLEIVEAGGSYEDAARRLAIHPGVAYMIATGLPADGSDALAAEDRERPGYIKTSTQHLANPAPVHNPAHHDEVQRWISKRVDADAQMQAAGTRHSPAPPPLGETGDDTDVLSVVGRDHNHIHKLVQRLQTTPTTAHTTRAKIVDAIRTALTRHEAAEEAHLWPFVQRALPDGDDIANEARRQEQQGRHTLEMLSQVDSGSDRFEELVQQLEHLIRVHVAFEDRVFLSVSEKTSRDERCDVGEALSGAERSNGGSS